MVSSTPKLGAGYLVGPLSATAFTHADLGTDIEYDEDWMKAICR